jgi:hypothetical protein
MNNEAQNGSGADWEKISAPEAKYVYGAYAVVAVAALISIALAKAQDLHIVVTEDFAAFAVLYIVAQAVERFVQPLTYLLGKPEEKKEAKTALNSSSQKAAALKTHNPTLSEAEADTAVRARRVLAVIQSERAVLFWAIATALALAITGALDLGMIDSVAEVSGGEDGEAPGSFHYLDVIVTGAVIGAGTKPLHDLIKVIQNTKQNTEAPAGGTTG